MRKLELSGKRFHCLTVIERSTSAPAGQRKWLCKCDCGNTRVVAGTHLTNGSVKSCGCKNFTWEHKNRKYEPEVAAYRAKAVNYKSQAVKRRLAWTLTIEQAVALLMGSCRYCGSPPYAPYELSRNRPLRRKEVVVLFNGIDRVDNDKGYTVENSVSCCKICNQAKMDMTLLDFEAWLDRITDFRSKQQK